MIDKIEKFIENYNGVYMISFTMDSMSNDIFIGLEATPIKNNFNEEFKEFIDSNKEGYTINWSINYLIPGMYSNNNDKKSGNDDGYIPIFIPFIF